MSTGITFHTYTSMSCLALFNIWRVVVIAVHSGGMCATAHHLSHTRCCAGAMTAEVGGACRRAGYITSHEQFVSAAAFLVLQQRQNYFLPICLYRVFEMRTR
jgi:hypothetical protein